MAFSTVFKTVTISSAPIFSANPIGVKEPNNGVGRCIDRLANNFTASDCLPKMAEKIGAFLLVSSSWWWWSGINKLSQKFEDF